MYLLATTVCHTWSCRHSAQHFCLWESRQIYFHNAQNLGVYYCCWICIYQCPHPTKHLYPMWWLVKALYFATVNLFLPPPWSSELNQVTIQWLSYSLVTCLDMSKLHLQNPKMHRVVLMQVSRVQLKVICIPFILDLFQLFTSLNSCYSKTIINYWQGKMVEQEHNFVSTWAVLSAACNVTSVWQVTTKYEA